MFQFTNLQPGSYNQSLYSMPPSLVERGFSTSPVVEVLSSESGLGRGRSNLSTQGLNLKTDNEPLTAARLILFFVCVCK